MDTPPVYGTMADQQAGSSSNLEENHISDVTAERRVKYGDKADKTLTQPLTTSQPAEEEANGVLNRRVAAGVSFDDVVVETAIAPREVGKRKRTVKGLWRICCSPLRRFLRFLTVEPMVLLFSIGFGAFGAYIPVNKQRKFSEYFNDSLAPLDAHGREVLLQQKLTEWNIYENIVARPMVILIGLFLGSYSDIYGRKPVMLLGTASAVLYVFCQQVFYSDAFFIPIWWILVQAIIYNLLGGSSAHHISSAYLVDVSSNSENLGIRLTLLVVMGTTGSFISNNVVNQLFPRIGVHVSLHYLIMFAQICCAVGFFYCLLFVRHVVPKVQQEKLLKAASVLIKGERNGDCGDKQTRKTTVAIPGTIHADDLPDDDETEPEPETKSFVANVKQKVKQFIAMEKKALKVIFRKRESYKRAFLICVVIIEALSGIAEKQESELMRIYTLREPLKWGHKEMSMYYNCLLIAVSVGTTIGMVVFKKILHLRDTTIILIALATNIADVSVIAFATESWMIYAGTLFLDGLAYTAVPAYEAFIASLVPKNEIGKIYAFLVVVHNLTAVVQLAFLQPLYIHTVATFPQLLWVLLGLFSLVASSIMAWVHVRYGIELKKGRIKLFTTTEEEEKQIRKITRAQGTEMVDLYEGPL